MATLPMLETISKACSSAQCWRFTRGSSTAVAGVDGARTRAWSFRDRPVCSLPPTAPTSSLRRRSLAVWMSSSPLTILNDPERHSSATLSRPSTSVDASSAVSTPALASALAYA